MRRRYFRPSPSFFGWNHLDGIEIGDATTRRRDDGRQAREDCRCTGLPQQLTYSAPLRTSRWDVLLQESCPAAVTMSGRGGTLGIISPPPPPLFVTMLFLLPPRLATARRATGMTAKGPRRRRMLMRWLAPWPAQLHCKRAERFAPVNLSGGNNMAKSIMVVRARRASCTRAAGCCARSSTNVCGISGTGIQC